MAKTDKSNKKSSLKGADSTKTKAIPATSKEILMKAAALARPAPRVKTNGKKTSSNESSDSSSAEEPSSGESRSSEEISQPKKAHPIKEKPAVPTPSKKKNIKAPSPAKQKSILSSENNSSDSSDDSEEISSPTKVAPAQAKKTLDSSKDLSDASSSEESSSEESDTSIKGTVSASMKTTPAAGVPLGETTITTSATKNAAGSSDDSSNSEESSSEDGDGDKKMMPLPAKVSPTKAKITSGSRDDPSIESGSEESSDDEDDKASAPARTVSAKVANKRKADSEAAAPPKKVKLANGDANDLNSAEETMSIFVGKLSWNVDNDWLAQEFAECGEVESAHVQMDRNTGRSRGFGYVHFKTTDAVAKAVALDGKEIDGRAVRIDRSNPPDKKASTEKRAQAFGDAPSPPSAVLFVGNLSFGANEDMLWETFGEHGDVKSVRVPTDRDTGKPKGFGYVEFSEVEAAKKAYEALQGFEFDGRSVRLDFSQPRDGAGGRGGGQGDRGGRGRGGFGGDRGWGGGRGGRGGFGGDRGRGGGRGGFGGDRGWGGGRGGRGGDRGRGTRGRGARTGGITQFAGQKTTFD